PRLPSGIRKRWGKSLQGVICNSEHLAKRFTALYPAVPNVRVIPRGVNCAVFVPDCPPIGPLAQQRPVRFTYFGGFSKGPLPPTFVKGGPILLRAWREAEDQLANLGASLLLGGPDTKTRIVTQWYRSLRYPQRVHIVGQVAPTDMPGYLRAA